MGIYRDGDGCNCVRLRDEQRCHGGLWQHRLSGQSQEAIRGSCGRRPVEDHGWYEAGCWVGTHHHWSTDDHSSSMKAATVCQSSYLCSTNVAKAVPSPAPTTAAAHDQRRADDGRVFDGPADYEPQAAAHCVEAEGRDQHSACQIWSATCRYTDENSCPAASTSGCRAATSTSLAVLEAAELYEDSAPATSSSAFTATRTAAARGTRLRDEQ